MNPFIRVLPLAVLCCGVLSGCGTQNGARFPTAASPTPPPSVPTPASITVSGLVTEVVGGQAVPLIGAHVEDSQRHVFVRTGDDGSYSLTGVVMSSFGGAYVYYAKEGYRPQVREFPLVGDTRVDVTLVRE
jgi:hypothetical protein